jgi:hypothetical protein
MSLSVEDIKTIQELIVESLKFLIAGRAVVKWEVSGTIRLCLLICVAVICGHVLLSPVFYFLTLTFSHATDGVSLLNCRGTPSQY